MQLDLWLNADSYAYYVVVERRVSCCLLDVRLAQLAEDYACDVLLLLSKQSRFSDRPSVVVPDYTKKMLATRSRWMDRRWIEMQ